MSKIQASKELAEKYLNIALEHKRFKEFLFGDPFYELVVKDSYGKDVFSAKHVMNAIYNKHVENPALQIDRMTYNTILEGIKNKKFQPYLLNIIEDIEYQIISESNGKAAFRLDCAMLLEEVKKHIIDNAENYKYEDLEYGKKSMWPDLEMSNIRIQQTTGNKIL